MDRLHVAWIAFGVYLAITTWLAWRGMKKTTSLSGFALGNGDMGPLLVGITLAAAHEPTELACTLDVSPGTRHQLRVAPDGDVSAVARGARLVIGSTHDP